MPVLSRLIPLTLILTLMACGPRATLNLSTLQSDNRTPEQEFFDGGLSGTANDEGRPYTSYVRTDDRQKWDEQITKNSSTENFAKQLLSAKSEINENHLKVSVTWAGVEKPL